MTFEDLRLWLPIAITLAIFAWNISVFRGGARKSELKALDEKIDAVDLRRQKDASDGQGSRAQLADRLTRVEAQLAQMPDKETVHRVEVTVARMEGDVKAQGATMMAIGESVKAATASVQRIESYMLETKK
jgi:hypothetical protein